MTMAQINIRILQTMVSGILLALGLRTRMQNPYVYVVFRAPSGRALRIRAGLPFVVVQVPLDCLHLDIYSSFLGTRPGNVR